jgi:hypothetical protein
MKEVLLRIFEANPNKRSVVFFYVQNNINHYFSICYKSNLEVIFEIELGDFQSLRSEKQLEVIYRIEEALDWYNLQP